MPGAKVKMVCRKCGSDRVLRDAYAAWSVEDQRWELTNVFDHAVCESKECDGNETRIEEVLCEDEQTAG
jgi:hypothetical protein